MADNKKLVGQDYSTADLKAKVTGRSKYAEDFRAEGMLFARLVLSPYSHARVKSIDAREALGDAQGLGICVLIGRARPEIRGLHDQRVALPMAA